MGPRIAQLIQTSTRSQINRLIKQAQHQQRPTHRRQAHLPAQTAQI